MYNIWKYYLYSCWVHGEIIYCNKQYAWCTCFKGQLIKIYQHLLLLSNIHVFLPVVFFSGGGVTSKICMKFILTSRTISTTRMDLLQEKDKLGDGFPCFFKCSSLLGEDEPFTFVYFSIGLVKTHQLEKPGDVLPQLYPQTSGQHRMIRFTSQVVSTSGRTWIDPIFNGCFWFPLGWDRWHILPQLAVKIPLTYHIVLVNWVINYIYITDPT